jgi:adenylosuccinate lyase
MIRALRDVVYSIDMDLTSLKALSPADGRYADKVQALRSIFSEFGLIRFRVLVEVRWLQSLADEPSIKELEPLSPVMKDMLNHIVDDFSTEDAKRIKKIEAKTNHDVKAVEYFIRERIGTGSDSTNLADFIHFACTSEDINNLAYALMLRTARDEILIPRMKELIARTRTMASSFAEIPMISRTHGQPASPTTVGKEFANVAQRLLRVQEQFAAVRILGKMNGAVGNFNAHVSAYPDTNWPAISSRFVESLGLEPNLLTTQIEPHDWMAESYPGFARMKANACSNPAFAWVGSFELSSGVKLYWRAIYPAWKGCEYPNFPVTWKLRIIQGRVVTAITPRNSALISASLRQECQ